jgi:hypothetical protein
MHPSKKYLIPGLKVLSIAFIIISDSSSCRKEEERIMVVRNDNISDISSTSAKAHATIIDIGNGIEQHGHCWSTSAEPSPEDNENMTKNGHVSAPGSYIGTMEDLMPDTKYYARA